MNSPCPIRWIAVLAAAIVVSNSDAQVRVGRAVVAVPSPHKLAQAVDRELYFIKKACSPSPEDYQRISDSAETLVAEMQEKYAEYGKSRDPKTWPRPEALITTHLLQLVGDTMPAEMAQAYRRELDARQHANHLATASLVTNVIDSHLRLTAEEIEGAIEKIAPMESTKTAQLPIAYLYQHMLPLPPQEKLPAVLTQEQMTLWKLQKHPKYNQPWVNYFNSENFLSSVRAPGVSIAPDPKQQRRIEKVDAIRANIAPARPIQLKPAPAKRIK